MLTKKLGFFEVARSKSIDFKFLQGLGDWHHAVSVSVGFDRGNQPFVTACNLLHQAHVGGQCLKVNVGADSSGLIHRRINEGSQCSTLFPKESVKDIGQQLGDVIVEVVEWQATAEGDGSS